MAVGDGARVGVAVEGGGVDEGAVCVAAFGVLIAPVAGAVVSVGGGRVGVFVTVGIGVAVGGTGVGGISVGSANGAGVGASAVTAGEHATIPIAQKTPPMANNTFRVNLAPRCLV